MQARKAVRCDGYDYWTALRDRTEMSD